MSTEKNTMPIQDKYLLTCREASIYFNIGLKNMRSLARDPSLKISVQIRGRTLIVRSKFEEYVLRLLEDEPAEDLSVPPS
ncbi:MAG: excisionase [Selenomonadaceae bacterium]|nr:excisionase [Selenomonadaceae bacterium]